MRYVDRDKDGNITGLFVQEQYEGQEKLPKDDSEVLTFINKPVPTPFVINYSLIPDADKQALRDATTILGLKSALLKILFDG